MGVPTAEPTLLDWAAINQVIATVKVATARLPGIARPLFLVGPQIGSARLSSAWLPRAEPAYRCAQRVAFDFQREDSGTVVKNCFDLR